MVSVLRWVICLIALNFEMLQAGSFDINDLDVGKAVTLPHPARTKIPSTASVMLTATDRGQTLKLTGLGPKGSQLVIAIFDPRADSVRRIS